MERNVTKNMFYWQKIIDTIKWNILAQTIMFKHDQNIIQGIGSTWTECWLDAVETRQTASTSPDYHLLADRLQTLHTQNKWMSKHSWTMDEEKKWAQRSRMTAHTPGLQDDSDHTACDPISRTVPVRSNCLGSAPGGVLVAAAMVTKKKSKVWILT